MKSKKKLYWEYRSMQRSFILIIITAILFAITNIYYHTSNANAAPTAQKTLWEGVLTPAGGGTPGTISFTVTEAADGTPTAVDYTMTVSHLVLTNDGVQCAAGGQTTYDGVHDNILPWQPLGELGHTWVDTLQFDALHPDPTQISVTGLLGRTLKGKYVGPNHSEGTVSVFYDIEMEGETFTIQCVWTWKITAGAGGLLVFSSTIYDVKEYEGTATITVVRTGIEQGEITVDYATSNGTATAGQDYSETAGTLSFADGETQKTFTIPILRDMETEGIETVNLKLSNPTNGAILGAPAQAILRIDDRPDLYVAPYALDNVKLVQEGNKFILKDIFITIKRNADPRESIVSGITVDVKSGNDIVYQEPAFSLTPSGDKVLRFDWDVTDRLIAGNGAATLILAPKVDPGNAIVERDETNNVRSVPRKLSVKPVIEVVPQFDLQGTFFLSGVAVDNKIDVKVLDWNGDADGKGESPYGMVHFELNANEVTKSGMLNGADHTYNMGSDFANVNACHKNILHVWASSAASPEIVSDRVTSQTSAVTLPKWVAWVQENLEKYDTNFMAKPLGTSVNYEYGFSFPEPAFEALYDVPSTVPVLGGAPIGVPATVAKINTKSSSGSDGKVEAVGKTGLTSAPLEILVAYLGSGKTKFRCKAGIPVLDFDEATVGFTLDSKQQIKEVKLRNVLPLLATQLTFIPLIGPRIATIIDTNKVGVKLTPSGGLHATFVDKGSGELEFLRSDGTVRLGVNTSATVALLENLRLTITGGGTPKVELAVPKPPGYIKDAGLALNFKATVKAWAFERDVSTGVNCTFLNGCSLGEIVQAATLPDGSGWQLITRNDAGQEYAIFIEAVDGATQRAMAARAMAANDDASILVMNIYPYPAPDLAIRNDGQRLLAYVHDDTSKAQGRGTEIHVLHWNGTAWRAPTNVTNDAQPDFNPAITFDQNNNGVMLWERSTLPTNITPALDVTFTQSLDIFASMWNGTTWSAPSNLSNNTLMDAALKVATGRDGTVMALWHTGDGESLVGTATKPLTLTHSLWDGTVWSTPAAIVNNQQDVFKSAMGVRSATEAAMVLSKASTGQGAESIELFYSTFNGATWRGLQQLTTNTVSDTSPAIAYDSSGMRHVIWLQDGKLMWLKDSWAASDAKALLPADAVTAISQFDLVQSATGTLAIVWQSTDGAAGGTSYVLYDPAADGWSAPHQLATDDRVDSVHAAALAPNGDLHMGYQQTALTYFTGTVAISTTQSISVTNMPQTGQSHLAYRTHTPSRDLTFDSLTLAPPNPAPGQMVTVTAVVRNAGDLTAIAPAVAVSVGTESPTTQTLSNIRGGYTHTVQVKMTMPVAASPQAVMATVDQNNQIAETDEANNTVSRTTTLPDLHVSVVDTIYHGAGVSVTLNIVNAGVLDIASAVDVVLRADHPMTGTQLAKSSLSVLASGANAPLTLVVSATDMTSITADRLWAIVDDADSVTEADEANNTTQTTLYVHPDLTLMATDIAAGPEELVITIHNKGVRAAANVRVWIAEGTNPPAAASTIYTETIPTIAAGELVTLTVAASTGHQQYAVEIDPDGAIVEINEGNNLAIGRVTVESRAGTGSKELYLPVIAR